LADSPSAGCRVSLDPLNRLTTSTSNGVTSAYSYDANSNRTGYTTSPGDWRGG
jgi:YD repeat-containing protein